MTQHSRVKKLTVSEQRYVEEMTRLDDDRPRTSTEAYRRAYDPKGNTTTVYNDASRVFNRPHIQAAIATIEAKVEADRRRASRGTLQHIQAKLWGIVDDPSATHRDQIAALKGIRDMLPKNAVEDSPNSDSAASKEELLKRLRTVLADVPEAIPVEPLADDDDTDDADVIDIHLLPPVGDGDEVGDTSDAGDEPEDESDPAY